MIAEQAVDQHHVARPRAVRRRARRRCGITPMPVVVMNSLSQAPRCTTLVSPVTISTPASPRGLRHRARRSRRSSSIVHAFLDDHGAGQIQRRRAADREIVDRAADRELADVAAGKEQRIDHEASRW